MIHRFKEKHIRILLSAARYKFVTYSQMIKLGIDNYTSNLSTLVRELSDNKRPLIKKIPHRIGDEVKVYLTRRGKDVLVKYYDFEEEQIHYPKGIIYTDTQDQKHRTSIIHFHIDLDISCAKNDVELLMCDRYFDFTGSNRVNRDLKSKTAIFYEKDKTIKADMVFKIQTSKQKELYFLELENGKDTKKAIGKCIRYGQAFLRGSANKKYNFPSGYRTLWVFQHESIMKSTIKRINAETPLLKDMTEFFLFKPLDKMTGNFFEDWQNLESQERKLYYT